MKIIRTQHGSETWDSAGVATDFEIQYLVIDVSDKSAAMSAVLAAAPQEWKGMKFSGVRFDEYDGDGNAEISALYEPDSSSDSGSDAADETVTVSFDCSGGTKHLNFARRQRAVGGEDDAGGAIGWNGKSGDECEIAGVDVPTGEMRETYTRVMRMSKLTTAYRRQLNRLVGKVNAAKFKGWEPGEVMFLGASFSGSVRGGTHITVTYNFQIRENESQAVVAEQECGPKQGFEYMWTRSKTEIRNGAPAVAVEKVYIAEVCPAADFKVLGL